jgi:hypothetical protein
MLEVNDRHFASILGTTEREKAQALKKTRSIERSRCTSDDDDIVFEDFARFSEPE